MSEHMNNVKMKVDTSTPLRNNSKSECDESILSPAVENVECSSYLRECDTEDGILFAKDTNEESSFASVSNLDKSAELFPCSPIPPRNIPHTLLPLLDTPDHRWSDSILTPFMLDKQNGTPSQFIRPRIPSDDEGFEIESPAGISSFQMYSDETLVEEFVLNQRTNSAQLSPIIQNSLKSQSKKSNKPKGIHKKLFSLPEENTSIVSDDYSYQRLGDMTLNNMERICQISESMFSDSITKSSIVKPNDDIKDFGMNTTEDHSPVSNFTDDESRRKIKFVYPYSFIKTPVNPLRVDEVIETVFSFEGNEDVCFKKSLLIPQAMVSFNELKNRENDTCRFTSSTSENSKLSFRTLIAIVLERKDIYLSLKLFFEVCRVNFARTRNVKFSSIASRLTAICERRDLITRLHEELFVLEKNIRSQLLEQFISFFKCHFHLMYNFFNLKKRNLCINFDFLEDGVDAKESTASVKRKLSAYNSTWNVTVFQAESLAAAQQLLADVQDSDFDSEYVEVNPFATKICTLEPFTLASHAFESKVPEQSVYHEQKSNSELNSLSLVSRQKLNKFSLGGGVEKFTSRNDEIVSEMRTNSKVTKPCSVQVNRSWIAEITSCQRTNAETSVMCSKIQQKSSSYSTESNIENFVGFKTAGGKNIKIEEQALMRSEAIFQDIAVSSSDEIVSTHLFEEELNSLKRSLQVTSPQRALEPKRMKSDEKTSLDCADPIMFSTTCNKAKQNVDFKRNDKDLFFTESTSKNFSDRVDCRLKKRDSMEEIEEDVTSAINDEKYDSSMDGSFDRCLRRSVSPEICSNSSSTSSRRFKLSKADFISDKVSPKMNEIKTSNETEELSLDDDSIQAAFECSFSLETDLSSSTASHNKLDIRENRLNKNECLPTASHNKSDIRENRLNKNECLPVKTSKMIAGFNTAGGHKLKVPESALKKVENLFQDIDEDIFAQVPESLFLVTNRSNSSISTNMSVLKNNKTELRKSGPSKIVVGFSTAAGNELNASKAALEKAQKLIESVDQELCMETIPWPVLSKNGSDSMISAAKCRDELKIDRKNFPVSNPPNVSVGFHTAAGSGLKISESALKRAQKIFQNIDNELSEEICLNKCSDRASILNDKLQTTSKNDRNEFLRTDAAITTVGFNAEVKHESSSKKPEGFVEDKDEILFKENCPVSPEIGLNSKTTSANRPKLSEKAFVNDEEDVDFLNYVNTSVGFNETDEKGSKIQTAALKTARNLFRNEVHDPPKKVNSSLCSNVVPNLKDSSSVSLKDDEIEFLKIDASETIAGRSRGTTKSTLQHISKQSQESIVSNEDFSKNAIQRSVMHETDMSVKIPSGNRLKLPAMNSKMNEEKIDVLNPVKISVGFSTASGNKLSVPKSSLEKSCKLFQSIDDDLFGEKCPSLFPTESNISFSQNSPSLNIDEFSKFDTPNMNPSCKMRISEPGTKKLKFTESVDTNSCSGDLQCPSSLVIPSVNQAGLSKISCEDDTKNVQICNPLEVSVGFNTAAGNKLSVPHSAFKIAQKLFQDIEDDLMTATYSNSYSTTNIASSTTSLEQQVTKKDKNLLLKNEPATLEIVKNKSESACEKVQRPASPEINSNSRISTSIRPKLSCLTLKNDKANRSKITKEFNPTNRGDLNAAKSTSMKVQMLPENVVDSLSGKILEKEDVTPNIRISTKKELLPEIMNAKNNSSKISVGFSTAAGNKVNFTHSALMRAQKLFENVSDDLVEEKTRNTQQNSLMVENECQKVNHESENWSPRNIQDELNASVPVTKEEEKISNSNLNCESSSEGLSGYSSTISTESILDQTDFRCKNDLKSEFPLATGSIHKEPIKRRSNNSSRDQFIGDASIVGQNSSLLVNSTTDEYAQNSVENQIKVTPPEKSRPSSPVFETRKLCYPRRRQKRRSQTSSVISNVTPLNVTYSGKDSENTSSNKSSPEDILRKIKDNFSFRSNKRKESVSSMPCPTPKRPKELNVVTLQSNVQVDKKCDVAEADRRPRCGSYLSNKKNGKSISLRQATGGLKPGRYTAEQLIQLGVIRAVVGVDAKNASEFIFSSEFLNLEKSKNTHGDDCKIIPSENNKVRFDDIARGFLTSPGVDRKLISEKWIRNHYRWIVWKLAAFEKSYPHLFARKYLTLDNVLYQLKYRYDREIDRCERSVLKRILEGDDTPHKPMILCVASIRPVSGAFNEFELELTDGWYSILSQVDIDMCKLIARNRVVVGSKLIIMNAELFGLSEGCDPLEVNGAVRLKISTNSSRLVRWDTRLGYHSSPSVPIISDLKTILPDGGVMYPVIAVIGRIYPLLFLEKKVEGHSELHNEKIELKKAANFDRERQACYEQLASTIIHEVEQENSTMNDSDEYYKIGMNPDIVALQNQRMADQERLNSLIKERIELKLPDKFRDRRKVVRLLKIRIVNDSSENKSESSSAIVTIWNPTEEIISLLKEGKSYFFHNLYANEMRNQELRLSSNRATRYESSSTLPKSTHHQRRYTPISELKPDYVSLFNEIDTVGIVIDGKHENQAHYQNTVYLADLRKNIVAVKFVLDVKDYGFEEILKHKRIVAAINLQWKRGQLHGKIPLTLVAEYTTFTQKSKYQHLQSRLDEFGMYFKIQCLDEFVDECEKKLKMIVESQYPAATSTPVKFIASKITAEKCLNVSNTSDSSMDTSSGCERSTKSKDTQSRIDRLRQYGEPPPLSPITLSSGMNIRRRRSRLSIQTCSFKSNDSKF